MSGLEAEVALRLGSLELDARLAVPRGTTTAVVGPNGAGKSTLLRVLAGLLAVDTGRVVLDGVVLDDSATGAFVPAERRPVGVVFQDHLLFPHLSAAQNVGFGLRARGASRSSADATAVRWLARVGLPDQATARPSTLSGGQAQRVALARALALEPSLLLLDEPLSALDATTRVSTRRDLRRHLDDHGGVRLLVTHDPLDAAALADLIVVLESGRVVQEGTLADLTARPRTPYVAELVGMNLLRGRSKAGAVDVGGLTLTVADAVDGDVLLAVAPRAVTLSRTRPSGTARNVWTGTIDGVERTGDRHRIRVRGPVTLVAEVTAAATADLQLGDGAEVWVAVKATEIDVSAA